MPPLLSVIIPHYNHLEALPKALDSVLAQTLKDLETVIVDDCSDLPCEDIVSAYRAKGLDITLVRNATRKYTKESRLVGVEAARGKLITFLDADDALYQDAALAHHAELLLETDADIVHFDCQYYRDGVEQEESRWWAKPLAEELRDGEIFRAWLRADCAGHMVWGKIATRELWLACLPHARSSSVRRYMEDFLFGALLFFHARRYIGSSRLGYVYFHDNAAALHKAFGRCTSLYAMLSELVPYMRRKGADAGLCADMRAYLLKKTRENMMNYLEWLYPHMQKNVLPPESVFREIREHADADRALRVLMTGLLQVLR